VLLSVFVPIGFISGISGELFRQFAVTVGVSMLLSAINALTLSPALCALLLKPHHGARRGPIGVVMRFIDRVRDAYGRAVARLVRIAIISIPIVGVAASPSTASARSRRRASCRRTIRAHSSPLCSCRTAHRSDAPSR